MLSPHLALTEIDERHFIHWYQLLIPPGVREAPRWALVVVESTDPLVVARVIVAGHGARGAIDPADAPLASLAPSALAGLARRLGVGAVIALSTDALARVSLDLERHLSLDQDPVEQGLVALRALKRLSGHGVWTEPPLLDLLPAPPFEALQRTFDLLVPDGTSLVAYVIEDDRSAVHASVVARKRGGSIDAVMMHPGLADIVPESALARDWPKAYPRVLAAAEERLAKPSVGLFLERATWMRILLGPADQLAREMNSKKVILDPAPAWLLGMVGGATVAAIATRGASALAGMLPSAFRERATDLGRRAQQAMKDSGAHPFALLGFDPLELWSQLRRYYKPS